MATADTSPGPGTLDLGVASNYVVIIQGKDRLTALRDMGVRRVNLYYTWHEFETTKPDDMTDLKQLDDTVAILKSLGMRASMIIEVTTTDCQKVEDASCWLQGNPGDFPSFPSHIPFKGWDQEPTLSAMSAFAKKLSHRWSPDVVTHILIGNEMDLFLRRDYTGLTSADNVAAFGKMLAAAVAASGDASKRSQIGSIFTLAVGQKGHNDIAKAIAPHVDVIAFTIYPGLQKLLLDIDGGKDISPWDPTPAHIDTWFGTAKTVAGAKRIVVTETGHPTRATIGSNADQKRFADNLISWLKKSGSQFDFVSWYSLWDNPCNPCNPFCYYHSCGLLTFECSNLSEPPADTCDQAWGGCDDNVCQGEKAQTKPALASWVAATK